MSNRNVGAANKMGLKATGSLLRRSDIRTTTDTSELQCDENMWQWQVDATLAMTTQRTTHTASNNSVKRVCHYIDHKRADNIHTNRILHLQLQRHAPPALDAVFPDPDGRGEFPRRSV